MSLILYLSHAVISSLFVMSWRHRDQTIVVSTAASQKLCACVHNDEGPVKSSQHINFSQENKSWESIALQFSSILGLTRLI